MGDNSLHLVRSDLIENKYGIASNLKFNEEIKELIARGESIHHFGFGQSPFPVVEKASEALKKYVGKCDYVAVKGIKQLGERICQFHKHFEDLTVTPDQVIVGPGSKELIFLLITVFNGDILINSPSWTTYRPQAHLARKSPYVIDSSEEDDWRITPEALERVLQNNTLSEYKLLIFTNPCNPTGTSYSENELKHLAEVFRQHKILVVSDEIYARLHYTGSHIPLMKVYSEGTILSSGFSKWSSAGGWRMGYHIYPKELKSLMSIVSSAGSHTYSCAPTPMQYAVAELLSDIPACEEYIRHTTRIMRAVGQFSTRELRLVGVKVTEPTAGYYIFPNFEVIRHGLQASGAHTGDQMCQLMLKEAKVAVLAGGPAHLRPVEELTVRLCYVNFDGTEALVESRRLGLDSPLDEAFVKQFCTPVYNGIQALKSWVCGLKAVDGFVGK